MQHSGMAGALTLAIFAVLSQEISGSGSFRGQHQHLNLESHATAPIALAATSQDSAPKPPPKPLLGAAEIVLFVIAPGSAIVSLLFVICWRKYEERQTAAGMQCPDLEIVEREPENLDEDVYGAGIASLVRDSWSLVQGKGDLTLRVGRLLGSMFIMSFVIFLQVFVISQMQALVAAPAVTEIRKIYGRYEYVMYGQSPSHIYLTPNGFPRGIDKQYFDPANFDLLSGDEKASACAIPFSQLRLLLPILFIWTLTMIGDMRRCGDLFVRLMLSTPTISDMKEAVIEGEGETEIIVGMTKKVKALVLCLCIIPRWFIDVYILWLGCRWLCATPSFSDLLLNSVALEFIVLLKDALYAGVVPDRNKRATQNTLIQPWQKTEPANYRVFLSAFLLLAVAFAWVQFYTFSFQAVLPDYKWDVAKTCAGYVESLTSGKAQ
eukprot:TRINITY_DN18094_c0_g1_i1.p1 TRINITY_DN18094_c0_g1~~TRINITY_DN18094_c0_g1_i1.p1  ORF type:complete len:435 (+),score=97.41 TRINITY_DN18094_c0_g1_i1:58-1362(+)